MLTAVINNPVLNCQVFPVFAKTDEPSTSQNNVPSESCPWEFIDENELASEMTASFSNTVSNTPAPEIDPDDFERLYQWFLS
jgi:hypothetical protein